MREHSEQIDQLATALSAAQAEFSAVPKGATNPFFKSKYADLPTVVATANPILTKHGLSVSQFLGFDEQGDTLTTWLLHKSGQFISDSMRLHLNKVDAQGQGSAVTYGRRYSYMSVLGLVADVDDDGNMASAGARARQQTPVAANGHVDARDIAALKTAAKGLKGQQVKLAFSACGLPIPSPLSFDSVPKEDAAALAAALAGIERES